MHPQTKEKLNYLKLDGFIQVAEEINNNPSQPILDMPEWLTLMVDRELQLRDARRLKRLIKTAKLRYPNACFEDIDWQQQRQFNQKQLRELSHNQWINKARNIILTGPTGVGKSYFACALGQQACRMQYSVRYFRMPRLIEVLHIAHADGSYHRKLELLAKTQLIILDDWGIDQLEREARRDMLEVLEDRVGNTSTIITSQLPIEHWHQYIGDGTLADAICDRILHNAYKLNIQGESMRKGQADLTDVDH